MSYGKNSIIKCADGWEITVLGCGRCKNDAGEWVESLAPAVWGESLELGHPNGEPLTDDFLACDALGDQYFYHYVPYEVLWNELARHGFIADDSPYKPYFLMEWAYKREADRVLELLVKLDKEQGRVHALQAMVKPAINCDGRNLDQEILDNDKILAETRKVDKVNPTP